MPMTQERILLGTAATICAGLLAALVFLPKSGSTVADGTTPPGPPGEEAGAGAPAAAPAAAALGSPGAVGAGEPGATAAPAGAGANPEAAAAGATASPAATSVAPGTPSPTPEGQPSFVSEQNKREVVLFFEKSDSEALGPERRKIFLTASPADQAKQIVVELINGPHSDALLPTFPQQTSLLGLYLDRSGAAYVDLSPEVVTFHPGGTSEELATIFSLVNSLTYNLPEIKRVHILVGGEEKETLKDHLDLRRDYLPDMSIVEMDSGR
jgi:germination protein M